MKEFISLTELLNGNSRKKVKSQSNGLQSDETLPSGLINGVNNDTANDMLEESQLDTPIELSSSPLISTIPEFQRVVPVGDNVSSESVMSFLKKKKKTNLPEEIKAEVIAIDDDCDNYGTTKDINGTTSIETINLEAEKFRNITNPTHLKDPSSFKKTSLKNLFSNFKRPERTSHQREENIDDTDVHNVESVELSKKKFVRRNNISKSTYLETPLPKYQLTQPPDDTINCSNFSPTLLNLTKSTITSPTYDINKMEDEYSKLNNIGNDSEAKLTRVIKYSNNCQKYSQLWTEVFRPRTLKDVMLEPKLKDDVNAWFLAAFEKLKKPTTRNKLVKSHKQQNNNEMMAFIVDDFNAFEEELEKHAVEEFVPLLILHGDGIGKNTLISTIMETIQGQILEINVSENRSKKDIFEKLIEYSTTHYVRNTKSHGIVLFDDVDVLFREHDKFFWQIVEKTLLKSRKPIVLVCQDLNYIPTNLIEIAEAEGSIFQVKKVAPRTISAFLDRYCQAIGLGLDKPLIETIVKVGNSDIRKCLMELQFWFSTMNELKIPDPPKQSPTESITLTNLNRKLDLASMSDILDRSTYDHSLIPQDDDYTLMNFDTKKRLDDTTDDQIRWRNDYMIDYKSHLIDHVRHQLLPFELNIGQYINNELKKCNELPNTSVGFSAIKYKRMKNTTIKYLQSRINKQSEATYGMRKTRNSRKMKEILQRFEGNFSSQEPTDYTINFDFASTSTKNIVEQLNPYVYEIAKSEHMAKEYNKKLYQEQIKDIPQDQQGDVIRELIQNSLFKPIWFHAYPKDLIDSWK